LRKNDAKSPVNSLGFKTWLYFMLFALSILLLLLFFQVILLEPFYKNTLKSDIKSLNKNIYNVTISNLDEETKVNEYNHLTNQHNACVLIYNSETTESKTYDVLGDNGCALYSQGNVNQSIINELDRSQEKDIYIQERMIDFSSLEVMIYGEKYVINNEVYFILSNIALQSMNEVIKTTQNQFVIITAIVLVLSVLISFIFSRIISNPIINIKKEAVKLSQGNYDVHYINSDINEVDELSETLVTAAGELSNIDEIRKELLANVSHDLKTPLTMIKAYAEMIRDISGGNKAKRNEHLEVIINETDTLNTLVSDMLDMSKLQSGVGKINIESFDLTDAVKSTSMRFDSLAKKEKVEIVLDCEPELVALGDKDRINEVIYNFISNAMKHYGEDRKIIVKAYLLNNKTIRVEVTDHGPGIDEDILPYIWDRYFKSDKKYKRAESGSGLGLAISKAILEQHGANYGVDTEKGAGSTFYFELPNASAD